MLPDWLTADQRALAEASAESVPVVTVKEQLPERGWHYVNGKYVLRGSELDQQMFPERLTKEEGRRRVISMNAIAAPSEIVVGNLYKWWNDIDVKRTYEVVSISKFKVFVKVLVDGVHVDDDVILVITFKNNVVPV